MKYHTTFLLCTLLLAPFAALPAAEAPSATKPNFLLIVSDDAGYADFGFQGCKDIPTPHLDRLASGGVRFAQGYVPGCVCSPSRAGILSGKTPARIGHEYNLESGGGIDTATVLLPARLKELGYHTGAIGKWHLGSTPEYQPWQRGFDEFYGFLAGQSNYLIPADKPQAKVSMLRNGEKVEEKEYLTAGFAREAVEFMERNKSQPWFLYLAFNAVHSPMQANPPALEKFVGIDDPQRRMLAAMTSSLDDGVGRMLEKLETLGLTKNTLVIFVNDNGGATYSKFYNTPLRGHKGSLWEGGIRVPFVARWPGVFTAAKDYTSPVCATDLLPTILAAAGAQSSTWSDSDGVNLLPYLTEQQKERPHQALFWRLGGVAAVRDGNWKLIRIRDHEPLLFNLADDIAEAHNLAAAQPDRVAELLKKIEAWEKPFPAPRWNNGEFWERVGIQYHTGPPRYQTPTSAAFQNRE